MIAWSPFATGKDCCTWAAASQLSLPAWFASITHVPTAAKETSPALIEQTAEALASMVKITGLPEARPWQLVCRGFHPPLHPLARWM